MYYVYRFKDADGNVIYVGKTRARIQTRIGQHLSPNGHLPSECYNQIDVIEYIELTNKIEMDIKELYFINIWKPEYNTQNKIEENLTMSIKEDDEWIVLKTKDEEYIEQLKEEIGNLQTTIKTIESNHEAELAKAYKEVKKKEIEVDELYERLFRSSDLNFGLEMDVFLDDMHGKQKTPPTLKINEAKIVLEHRNDIKFYSNVHVNNNEKFSLVLYRRHGRIFIKELNTSYKFPVNWDEKDQQDYKIMEHFDIVMVADMCEFTTSDEHYKESLIILNQCKRRVA